MLDARDRHGARLLSQLTAVLAEAGIGMSDVTAIGVGTGPGSFTGLRVGLATAKTLAAIRHLPLVGLPTDEALRQAAANESGASGWADAAVLLPAGARDHYLGLPGSDPVLVPPGTDLERLVGVASGGCRGRRGGRRLAGPPASGGGRPGPARSPGPRPRGLRWPAARACWSCSTLRLAQG